ncbi:unnamed protein product [Rotaria sp. Silwood1]|nr:unnamed protein product [Rotaria sp. Silwood1]CAF4803494.1 unnamed protein product [Rotaria sp. Silwood1]
MKDPPSPIDEAILDRIHGSMIGMALGDALGAHVEFRPRQYLVKNPVVDLKGGGTWGLEKGQEFNVNCSEEGVAGNGALMRLAPVPLFFYKDPAHAVEYSGLSGLITHGDEKAYDACRYYGALIVAAVNGATKEELVDKKFYEKNKKWFGNRSLHPDIEKIAQGSYQKGGYDKGIRGKGYIVDSLEAALWAFWSDNGSFRDGVLAAVNLGDDTDTTAAIYGQLAGAHYGYKNLPEEWKKEVYAKKFIQCLSKWIVYEGANWSPDGSKTSEIASATINVPFNQPKTTLNEPSVQERNTKYQPQLSTKQSDSQAACTTKLEQSIDPATGHRLQNPNFSKTSEAQRQNSVQHQNTRPSSHQNYGVKNAEHRRSILDNIKKLQAKCPEHYATMQT